MLRKLLVLAAVAGTAYLGFALARVRAFDCDEDAPAGDDLGSVSLLKPLCGLESELYENLCSFCTQDYGDYRVIMSVRTQTDPAVEIARRVAARFPERAELVVGADGSAARNRKVANLAAALARAGGEIVVIADADMRVERDYLRRVVAPLRDERVGAVTCLYRGSDGGETVSALGAMFINEQFAPSVLVAGALEPPAYCFGATIVVRRRVLDAVGGFGALADHVADDHRLGRLVVEHGDRVVLSRYVVENVLREPNLWSLWSRELRWSRTIRSVRPVGHALSFVTFGLPLALLGTLAARGSFASVCLLATAGGLRFALHRAVNDVFEVPRPPPALLIPLRDALSLAIWLGSFFGRDVVWREQNLALDPRGRIEAIEAKG